MLLRTMIWVAVFEGCGMFFQTLWDLRPAGDLPQGPRCQVGKGGVVILMGYISTVGEAVLWFELTACSKNHEWKAWSQLMDPVREVIGSWGL